MVLNGAIEVPSEEDGYIMSHNKAEDECDSATLRKIVVGLLAHNMKRATVSKVVKDLELVLKEVKIVQTDAVELFMTHVLHEAADLRMKNPDSDPENGDAGVVMELMRALQGVSARHKR